MQSATMIETQKSHSTSLFREFFRTEAAAGALVLICASAAVVIANSDWAGAYQRLWATPVAIAWGGHALSLTLHEWINDGLMAVFFLFVGLEIKREVLAGELASPREAALPIAAAIGGMIVPAFVYLLASGGGAAARGWAIPTATDIAFALGVLALVAPRAPSGLKIFLAALAIVDDIGAVLVIALFYTRQIAWGALGAAGVILSLLITLNVLQVRRLTPYLVLGLGLWFFVHESGVHATVAGVLLAFAIPTKTRINTAEFSAKAHGLLDRFDRTETGDFLVLTSKEQQQALIGLERARDLVTAPLLRLEHALHGLSAFAVMPLFALSNAGVGVSGSSGGRVTAAVILGLAVGKPLGITAAAFAAVKLRLAELPAGVNWTALHGCAWLGGIGFTMSLFISTLAFEGIDLLDTARTGILAGSILAGIVGTIVLRFDIRTPQQNVAATGPVVRDPGTRRPLPFRAHSLG
jgi:Na+:H+ antiporter, NhaA family